MAGVSGSISVSTPASAENCQWILVQKGEDASSSRLTISHDAVKIVNDKYDVQLAMTGPTWFVHCFSLKEKVEWVGHYKEFKGERLFSPFADKNLTAARFKLSGKGNMKGLKFSRYVDVRSPLRQVYGADDISVAEPVAQFLCRYYDLPAIAQVPIYRVYYRASSLKPKYDDKRWTFEEFSDDMRTGAIVTLSTVSWKKVPYKAADYTLPRGFKRVQSPDKVVYIGDRKSGMIEFIDGVGFRSAEIDDGGKVTQSKNRR